MKHKLATAVIGFYFTQVKRSNIFNRLSQTNTTQQKYRSNKRRFMGHHKKLETKKFNGTRDNKIGVKL